MLGPAPIEVLRQVYCCIVRDRLTNREGTNEYVCEQSILDISDAAPARLDEQGVQRRRRPSLSHLGPIGKADDCHPALCERSDTLLGYPRLPFASHAWEAFRDSVTLRLYPE